MGSLWPTEGRQAIPTARSWGCHPSGRSRGGVPWREKAAFRELTPLHPTVPGASCPLSSGKDLPPHPVRVPSRLLLLFRARLGRRVRSERQALPQQLRALGPHAHGTSFPRTGVPRPPRPRPPRTALPPSREISGSLRFRYLALQNRTASFQRLPGDWVVRVIYSHRVRFWVIDRF